jgi:thioredoxin-like negative regulator of GroEL
LFVFLLSVICYLPSSSQTVSQLTKAGDKKIAEGDYYAASQYFKDALNKDEENIDLNFKYAEACSMFNDLDGCRFRLPRSN